MEHLRTCGVLAVSAVAILSAQPAVDANRVALAQLRARLAGHENEPAETFFTNVSILKGRPAGRLPGMMEALTGLIGVDCAYCHVDGNWASDDKPAKRTARAHFDMMARLNQEQFEGRNAISCWTCHRGSPHPELTGRASPPLVPPTPPGTFVAIIVPDVEATAHWYEEKLGFHESKRSRAPSGAARSITVESDFAMVEIIEHDRSVPLESIVPDAGRRRLVRGISKAGFFVSGIEKIEADLQGRGVEFVSHLFSDDDLHLKSFIVRDNAGNYIQFMERAAR